MPKKRALLLSTAILLAPACADPITTTSSSSGSGGAAGGGGTGGVDPTPYLTAPTSCAYDCPGKGCSEAETPYQCPAVGAWASIPHLDACPAWDGTYPTPPLGACAASAPFGAALEATGPSAIKPAARVLPDGRYIEPAGVEHVFDEPGVRGGTTSALALVPGTSYALVLDTGNDDHVLRAVDRTKIGSAAGPVTSTLVFQPPENLNSAIAVVSSTLIYLPTSYGVAQAVTFDPATGTLTRNDAASIPIPAVGQNPYFAASLAASPDQKRLIVTPVLEARAVVLDIDPLSPTYKTELGEVDLNEKETFGVFFDPHDASGRFAYTSVWGSRKVLEIDLLNPSMPVVSRTFSTEGNPQGISFLNGRWMAVANDYGETISLIDRMTNAVTHVPVEAAPHAPGLDASLVAFDEASSRLYVLFSGVNAVAGYDVDLAQSPPVLTPLGQLPTSWWPAGLAVGEAGEVIIANMRGGPIGSYNDPNPIGSGQGDDEMRGSIQIIQAPSAAQLSAGEAVVKASYGVGSRPGYPTVSCPPGAADFPVPASNTEGPSKAITRVFFIVRENKTFDALFGDLSTVEGDPLLAMKPTTAEMDMVWPNLRTLGQDFVLADNFYNLAVKSTQGHQWTTYGRTTDFCERTWSQDARQVPLCGIASVGRPDEGSLFEWLQNHGVKYNILGEIVGNPKSLPPGFDPIDAKYPGGPFQNISYNDLEKACYAAGRLRVACNLEPFVYMTLPNDHTVGLSSTNPTPETMCAVNDEATGMFLDALSHSPYWANSLVVITEDDPQQGGDHVDYHRTPLVLISPWVKRGYVTHTHIDVASLHKLFAHIFGIPYANLEIENAGLPLDAFTSTPDYTPYTYIPHQWPIGCGTGVTSAEEQITASWDMSYPDAQPGLGDQVMRWMRREQLQTLPPGLAAAVEARKARKAQGWVPRVDRDDDDDD